MLILRKVLVCLVDALLNLGLGEVSDAQHGCRDALAVVDGILKHGRAHGCFWESLLAARPDPEEDSQSGLGDLLKRLPGVCSCGGGSKDNALRMARRSADPITQNAGMKTQHFASYLIVG